MSGEERPVDEQLARRVAELFEQHRSAVFAYLARLTASAEMAEELTQETFLKVFAARDRLSEVANERAWIFRVATNACFSALRRRRRFAWLPFEMAAQSARTESVAEQVIRRNAVEAALARVPTKYRTPLLLFGYYGFSVAETAAILGISEGAVRTRVYRAKELFQRAFEQDREK